MKTVVELFRRLEALGIPYAVLRNYEQLPDLRVSGHGKTTDIDLVVADAEMLRFRKLLASLAEDLAWDALSECDHFSGSQSRHHNIEIFRFYRVSPLEFLQIDVFHGFVSWGLPLMDEADLLSDRSYDAQRGLTRINLLRENTYRLVQLHGLGHSKRFTEKTNRYRTKVLDTLSAQPAEYRAFVRTYLGVPGLAAVRALERSSGEVFSKVMPLVKIWFGLRFTLRRPGQSLQYVYQRILDHRARFKTRQCGSLLKVHADTADARGLCLSVMDSFTRLHAFPARLEKSGPAGSFTGNERRAMERGAVVIQWVGRDDADIVVVRGESARSVASKIIGFSLHRHTLLHSGMSRARVLAEGPAA